MCRSRPEVAAMRNRTLIDPMGEYPSEGLRTVERIALDVLQRVPGATVSRTRDAFQLECGGEEGIVLIVTDGGVELRLPTVEWTCGSHGPAASSTLWKRAAWTRRTWRELEGWIAAALRARQEQFAACRYCGERVAPEHRYDDETCQGCASSQMGVVY